MKVKHRSYNVYDSTGKQVFHGSVPEIAAHFYLSDAFVYDVARGRCKRFLGEYTLEYAGDEPYIPKPKEEEDWE